MTLKSPTSLVIDETTIAIQSDHKNTIFKGSQPENNGSWVCLRGSNGEQREELELILRLDLSLKHRTVKKALETDIVPTVKNIEVRAIHFEKEFVKEAREFLRDYKSLEKEADESLEKTVENADLIARIQDKTLANGELQKIIKGKGMDTKFGKPTILGKSLLYNQSEINQLLDNRSRLNLKDLNLQNHGLPPKLSKK
ncbi:hypothetical protein Tco_0102886 [Tanacetum coccineum]